MNGYPLEFTTAEIEEFGEIGDVLKVFLQEQTKQIQSEMEERFPDLPERAVRKVLNSFATLQGTKIPQLRSELSVAPLNEDELDVILNRLQQARILREEEGTYELAHDTLAGEIAGQRSGAEQALLEITELVRNRFRAFSRVQTYLDAKELQLVETYESQLREEHKITEEEWDFIDISVQEALRKKRKRNRINVGIIAMLSLLLLFSGWQWQKAKKNEEYANAARFYS